MSVKYSKFDGNNKHRGKILELAKKVATQEINIKYIQNHLMQKYLAICSN